MLFFCTYTLMHFRKACRNMQGCWRIFPQVIWDIPPVFCCFCFLTLHIRGPHRQIHIDQSKDDCKQADCTCVYTIDILLLYTSTWHVLLLHVTSSAYPVSICLPPSFLLCLIPLLQGVMFIFRFVPICFSIFRAHLGATRTTSVCILGLPLVLDFRSVCLLIVEFVASL